MKTKTFACAWVLVSVGLAAAGCGGSTDVIQKPGSGVVRAALHQMRDCAQLEQELKQDALVKMNAAIDAQIAMIQQYGSGYWGGYADDNTAAPSGEVGAGQGGSNSAPPRASEYSDTNTQVAGVDEADIVKTDGTYLYLLHGQSFKVLTAYPASELAQTSSFAIEGQPLEMYVTDDNKVVVYSQVDGAPIYEEAGIEPRTSYYDYAYVGADVAAEPGMPGGAYYVHPLTKITVLTLADTQPSVTSEFYFEGTYASSRRVDQYVRTVLQGAAYGPQLSYWPSNVSYPADAQQMIAALQQLRAENAAKINASELADWLPYHMTRVGGQLQASLTACEEFYLPTAGSTSFGMVQIESIDLQNPTASPRGASIVGNVNTVYSSAGAMYLAAQAWIDPGTVMAAAGSAPVASAGEGESSPAAPPSVGSGGAASSGSKVMALDNTPVSMVYTHLHKFDLLRDPANPTYVASGTVVGGVLNQFSLDEHNGRLRVATTDERANTDWESSRVNHVFILGQAGDLLEVVGSIENLAPGERIYSARFLGDKGYVVTFRQVDPLFALDLADPTNPQVLGELKIPGFSEYMHPLDDTHLLTIGQSEDRNLALQIFDVTNPAQPVQAHVYSFTGADGYGYSEAQSNHKAFTYFASRKLLAFPFVSYASQGMRSSLELFRIDVAEGIQPVGSIDHSPLFGPEEQSGYCGGFYGVQVRRGVFMDDFVYSISYAGVMAHDTRDLATPIATLPLEAPASDYSGCAYY